jgi:hypothetical protein
MLASVRHSRSVMLASVKLNWHLECIYQLFIQLLDIPGTDFLQGVFDSSTCHGAFGVAGHLTTSR